MKTFLAFASLLVAASLVGGCAGRTEPQEHVFPDLAADRPEARARGVADAERDVAAGAPLIRTFGLRSGEGCDVDGETGIPYRSRGCMIDPDGLAYDAGYNATIHAAFRAGKLEGRTFLAKFVTRERADARFRDGQGTSVRVGADPIASPNGAFVLRVTPDEETTVLECSNLCVATPADAARGQWREIHFIAGSAARVAFEPDGTTLLVRDDRRGRTKAFDLPSGLLLQRFNDDEAGATTKAR